MSRINRSEFVNRFQDKALDLSKLDRDAKDQLWSAGASAWGVSRADLNKDGKIGGEEELNQLFSYVDKYDQNGSFGSIDTTTPQGTPTASGKIVSVLDLLTQHSPSVAPTPTAPTSTAPTPTAPTPTTPSPTAPGDSSWIQVSLGQSMLRTGDQGLAVAKLQKSLSHLGFPAGDSGQFDLNTKRSVIQFQRAHGLSADGVVGKDTAGKLEWENIRGGHQLLSHGSQGEAVRSMQRALSSAGFGVQDTGIFGAQTQEQLLAFQRANHVQATGKFGPTTLQALERAAGSSSTTSARGRQQMQEMLNYSRNQSLGRRPDGFCYTHVANYIDRVGYGKIPKWGFNANIPSSHWAEARQFAEYLNQNGNAERMGLKRLDIDNPYDAPPGAIVVVRAGTPGTRHATAGDIAIKGEGNSFYNGGEMSYRGSHNFRPGNNYVLGIYVPA